MGAGGIESGSEAVVSLEHVDAGYRGKTVLRDVSFEVMRGEVFILLGGSGCGKTTIMKHMIGLNPVRAGTLKVCGEEWSRRTRQSLCRKIGVMYQSGALFGSMTCIKNVMLPLEEFSSLDRRAREKRAMELLEDVELTHAANLLPGEISGGMRKRVAIARAMALDPQIVFLDEPSAGLDPITSSSLDDLILKLRGEKGMTFVVVTHELPSIFKIGDRAAMFDRDRGGMVALGSPRELAKSGGDDFVTRFFNRGDVK